MARRSDHTREELKALAIAAGHQLLAEEGLQKFSARKMAGAIGYTVGTLYNVFGDYDDMLLHINAVTLDDMAERMQASITADDSPKDALMCISHAYITYAKTHPHLWHALYDHRLPEGRILPSWYAEKIRRNFTGIEAVCRTIDGLHPQHAAKAAHVCWAGVHGICLLGMSDNLDMAEAGTADAMLASFIDIYIAGITGIK